MGSITKNIKKIKETIKKDRGFDVIVVVASNGNSKYWEWRLSATRNEVLSPKTKIICTEEKWEKGAGQLLGTLHAFEEANKKKNLKGVLKRGGTVAFYHTAGYGKRMAPLCGAEGNNKPAIKLPRPMEIEGGDTLLTVLEAGILSTQCYARTREGRICVFWGDQVIIPSGTMRRKTNLPVEIFGIKQRFTLSLREWRKNWENYGILIPKKDKGILQREKSNWKQLRKLIEKKYIKPTPTRRIELIKSMGCFSMSFSFMAALLREFSKELELKKRKLDTDGQLWFPLTCTSSEYINKGGSIIYWRRLKRFKKKFLAKERKKVLVNAKNLGERTLWFDYGTLANYHKNLSILLESSYEGRVTRDFYGLNKYLIKKEKTKDLKIKKSMIINSEIEKGSIENSIIFGSKIKRAKIKRAIIINSEIKNINSKRVLIYNLREPKGIRALPNEVITDIIVAEGTKIRMRSSLVRDSKKDWKIRLPQNPFSYSEIERCLARLSATTFRVKI